MYDEPSHFLLVSTCYVVVGACLTITFNLQKHKTLHMTNNSVTMLLTNILLKKSLRTTNTTNDGNNSCHISFTWVMKKCESKSRRGLLKGVIDFQRITANKSFRVRIIQGGSNMTGTDLYVNKPQCAAAVRPWESEATTSTLPPARVTTCSVLSGSC